MAKKKKAQILPPENVKILPPNQLPPNTIQEISLKLLDLELSNLTMRE